MARLKFTKDHEVLEELIRRAHLFTDAQIDSLNPGKMDVAASLLDVPGEDDHPFAHLTEFDRENPHIHMLRLMRNPEFFPFTCKHLFGKPYGGGPLEILPIQHVSLKELWFRQFPLLVASRGYGKSFLLALYSLLRALFCQGSKIVMVAASFRQAKAVFEYVERLWWSSPVFRDLVEAGASTKGRKSGPRRDVDRVEFILGDSVIIGLPLGSGEKIRGLRANYVLCDEVASVNEDIYAVVVQGFGAVTADPIGNVKDRARQRILKRLGLWTQEMDEEEAKRVRGNQSVLSGTAYYQFNHFYRYWKEYRDILLTKGDPKALEEVLKGPPPTGFDWRDYSILRIPHDLIPHGYMDEKTVARARQITSTVQYNLEFKAVFSADSDGFFKRSLIEKCVVGKTDDEKPVTFPSCGKVEFTAVIAGQPDRKYIYGIDPASERDHFSIVVIEQWAEHRRVVYCWTSSKKEHLRRLKLGKAAGQHDFYRFAVRKIRDLMKVFPTERLVVDAGGGGVTIREALGDPDKLEPGELGIYEAIEEGKTKPTDHMEGLHILEMVQFRDNAWVVEANEGLKKDLEDRTLLFPLLDSLALGLAEAADEAAGRISRDEDGNPIFETYDTLESCMQEIEEMKDELASIVVSETATGMRRWDTPDTKLPGAKKGRMRKDRYSALLMANMAARQDARRIPTRVYEGTSGGFSGDIVAERRKNPNRLERGKLYKGPAWFQGGVAALGGSYGRLVKRGVGV